MNKYQEGIASFREGKFDEALEIFNHLIEEDPLRADFIEYRGRILSRKGSFAEALEDYDQLLSLEPTNTDFIGDRAVVLHLLNRHIESLSELNRALDLDPKNPYRYSSRAFLKDRIGDFEGAIADYEKAIEIDPDDAVAFNNKGLVEEKMGYKDQSNKSLQTADNFSPKHSKNKHEEGSPDQSKIPIQLRQGNPAKNLTISSYLHTISRIFIHRDTRKEFFRYLFSGFKSS